MNRCLAILLALVFATVSVSSACVAAPSDLVRFTLEPERGGDGRIHATFRDEGRAAHENNWSTGFPPAELIGLDPGSFRASGSRPLRFALVREAGRLDCSGSGGNSHASGNCGFTPDAFCRASGTGCRIGCTAWGSVSTPRCWRSRRP